MIEPYLILVETRLVAAVGPMFAAVERRTPLFLPQNGETHVSITVSPVAADGALIGREQLTIEILVRGMCKAPTTTDAIDRARFAVDYARDRILASGEEIVSSIEGTTYEEEVVLDSGQPVVMHDCVIRAQLRNDADAAQILGIVTAVDAAPVGIGAEVHVNLLQPTIVLERPNQYVMAPNEVAGYYANAAGFVIEVLRDDSVQASAPAGAGAQRVEFLSLPAGAYRLAINTGATRVITASTITLVEAP